MGLIVDRSELRSNVTPLDVAEQAWLRRLERVLRDMPARLVLMEVGGHIEVIDRAAATVYDLALEDGWAARNGVVLATVDHSSGALFGVSG